MNPYHKERIKTQANTFSFFYFATTLLIFVTWFFHFFIHLKSKRNNQIIKRLDRIEIINCFETLNTIYALAVFTLYLVDKKESI